MLDFWQTIFIGVFKGLGKQDICNKINIFSYYVLCVPLAIAFTFYLPTGGYYHNGLGPVGIWVGFCIGLLIEIIIINMYLVVILDWHAIALESQERIRLDTKQNQ